MTTYKESGVDLESGNTASEIFFNACKLTWKNREGKVGEIKSDANDFSGLRFMDLGGISGLRQGTNSDGIGTKVNISQRLGKHDTIAYDLVAMVADDASREGAEPIWMTNVLDVNSLEENIECIRQLATGLANAANEAGIAVVNGEIAELGNLVWGHGTFNYNWSASVIWVAGKKNLIDRKSIAPGQYLVALKEKGFRSNGISLVRKIMQNNYGDEWHKEQPMLALQILEHSTIYSKLIKDMIGDYFSPQNANITGIAHITGGGIPEKLGRVLKTTGHGANLDNLFEPCDAMKRLQELGDVADEEAYRALNMGQGMIIATTEPDKVQEYAAKHNIESRNAGEIMQEPGIVIKSKGVKSEGRYLHF